MKEYDALRHTAYAIAIVVFMERFLQALAVFLTLVDVYKLLLFGIVGITSLLLGLFKFHKSLSFGLVFGGLLASGIAWHFRLTEFLQFIIACICLILICFALYRLYKNQYSLKK